MIGAPTHLYTSIATTERPGRTRDTTGSVVEALAAHLVDIKCRVSRLAGSELIAAGRLNPNVTVGVYVEGEIDVQPDDRVRVGGRIFDVRAVVPFGSLETEPYQRLDCEEATPDGDG